MTARIYGYIRVSSDDQKKGYGPEIQRSCAEKYIEYVLSLPQFAGLERGQVMEEAEGVSAFKVPFLQRATGKALNAKLQRGDHIVIAKLDRGFRNPKDAFTMIEYWRDRGIVAHFADLGVSTASANGELLIGIMAVCAGWFSRLLSERMKEVFALKKSRKEICGNQYKSKAGYLRVKVRKPGNKTVSIWVPNESDRPILQAVAFLRDHCKVHYLPTRNGRKEYEVLPTELANAHAKWTQTSWRIISDLVESHQAAQEERKPRPRREGRLWSEDRCQEAYRIWKTQDQL